MITTVTLNPCMDLTIQLPSLQVGGLNIVKSQRTDVAGKGVNVSVVLRELGEKSLCTGIIFDGNGKKLTDYLDSMQIPHDFVVAKGEIRTNIKLIDGEKNQMTEVNSKGVPVPKEIITEFFNKLQACTSSSHIVVFSGRIPNGADTDIYKQAIVKLQNTNAKIILDAEKEPLLLGIEAKPYLIKPNTFELESSFGLTIKNHTDAVNACRLVISKGVQVVCLSMGEHGAIIADKAHSYYAKPLDITPKGFQGAGDSMVAGLCSALSKCADISDMLADGVAAASGSLIREGTLLCTKADFNTLRKQVELEQLD